jgi:hypothetical protein
MKYNFFNQFRLLSLKRRSKLCQLFLNSSRKTINYSVVIDLKNHLCIANVLLFLILSLFIILYNIFLSFIKVSYNCFFVLIYKKIARLVFEYFNYNLVLLEIN